jgi:hypothetical protein
MPTGMVLEGRSVMTRMLGVVSALLLTLLVLVPVAAADEFGDRSEHILVSTGGDIAVAAGQRADVLVVVSGNATVAGTVRDVIVINGSVAFTGGHAGGLSIIRGTASLDATSVINGEIRTFDAVITRAPGATVSGPIRDFRSDFGSVFSLFGPFVLLVYVGFSLAAIVAGVALAGIAGRQVGRAEGIITKEPLLAIVASLLGFVAFIVAGTLAVITVIGIPLGLAILAFVFPILLFVGYLVAGIWIGDVVLRRMSSAPETDRPYVAAIVGIGILSVIGIIPFANAIPGFLGFGAVLLLIWRTLRRETTATEPAGQALVGATAV